MEPRDCTWCGSAKSIERGVCQVCLMRFPEEDDAPEIVIELPQIPDRDVQDEPRERRVSGEE